MPILDKAIPTKNEKRMKRIKKRLKKFSFFLKRKIFFSITPIGKRETFNPPLYN